MIIIITFFFHAFSLQHISYPAVSDSCKNLIGQMLAKDVKKRPSLGEVMKHKWINLDHEGKDLNEIYHLKQFTGSELNLIDQSLIGK